MAHHHNPQVRWRYVTGYMINQYMGVVIAIYFPGDIILLKVASGDEPSGIWESEMETSAVRWQVFTTRKWSKYVPAILAMFHRLFQAMTFQLMFATSPLCLESRFLVPWSEKKKLQAFRVSGVVLFLVFVWWESQGSELQTETNSELEDFFCSKMRVVNQMYHFCFWTRD